MAENEILSQDTALSPVDIRPFIHEIRGRQVMLDRDLAVLYGVETKNLNKAVKRNLDRFPADFMFKLSDEEFLRFQFVTSKNGVERRGGTRYRPYVFTEQGVAMLSGVLHSETAVRVNIEIMRAFVALRKALSTIAPELASLNARLEANERRQITDQTRNEARFDEIFEKMSEGNLPAQQIFYQGKFWDAKSLLIKFIRRAKRELTIVDDYLGVATLDMLAKRTRSVKITVFTHGNGELAETDFEAFGRQCGNLTKSICGSCHDRFIIADRQEIYWIGASLKDAGRLTFAVAKLESSLIPALLASLEKAVSARTEYGGAAAKNRKGI